MRLMETAGDAQMLGAALNHSALNLANALGAWLGGLVIAAGLGYRAPSVVGAGLAVAGLVPLAVSARAAPPRRRRADAGGRSAAVDRAGSAVARGLTPLQRRLQRCAAPHAQRSADRPDIPRILALSAPQAPRTRPSPAPPG